MYKLFNYNNELAGIIKEEDSFRISIPLDPANTDYQQFLKYQAEGGKVYGADEEIPADEGTQ